MNFKLQLTCALFISLLCAIGFGFIALLVSDKKIAKFDNVITTFIQGLETSALTSILKFFTFIGGGFPIGVVSIIVLFFLYKVLHHQRELILFIWVVIVSLAQMALASQVDIQWLLLVCTAKSLFYFGGIFQLPLVVER